MPALSSGSARPGLVERTLQRHRTYGILRAVHASLFRRLARMGFHFYLVSLGDDRPEIAHPVLPPGYSTRPVELEELWEWVGKVEGLTETFLDDAIARGDRCVGNFLHGELVGYGFVARRRAPVTDQMEVVISDRLVYRYKGWTHPDHRRKHLSHSRGRVNRTLFPLTEGIRTIDYVAVYNLASRLQHADVHPIRLGYCGFIRLGGREYPFTGRVPRRFGFRLARRPTPRGATDSSLTNRA